MEESEKEIQADLVDPVNQRIGVTNVQIRPVVDSTKWLEEITNDRSFLRVINDCQIWLENSKRNNPVFNPYGLIDEEILVLLLYTHTQIQTQLNEYLLSGIPNCWSLFFEHLENAFLRLPKTRITGYKSILLTDLHKDKLYPGAKIINLPFFCSISSDGDKVLENAKSGKSIIVLENVNVRSLKEYSLVKLEEEFFVFPRSHFVVSKIRKDKIAGLEYVQVIILPDQDMTDEKLI